MKSNARIGAFCLACLCAFGLAVPLRAQQEFTVDMEATGAIVQPELAFGMDQAATDGFDGEPLDVSAPPPGPFGRDLYFMAVSGQPNRLTKDTRAPNTTDVWTLVVTLNPGDTMQLSWTLPAGFVDNVETLDLESDGSVVADMKTETSVEVTQSRTFQIIYKEAPANLRPVPRDDEAFMLVSDGSVTVDVLANDEDFDGGTLSLDSVDDPADGTAVITQDDQITYTPDNGVTLPLTDAFNYTISDGQGGQASAMLTVHVDEHVLAQRSHPDRVASDNDLSVAVSIIHDGQLATLSIVETLPRTSETNPVPWQYVAGSLTGDAAGLTAVQNGNTLEIDFGTAVPASPVEFSYTVHVPAGDANEKTFTGDVIAEINGTESRFSIPDTVVEVVDVLFHSADYEGGQGDWVISFTELLRVIAYYNAGAYHSDPGNGLDGFTPGAGQIAGAAHSADYEGGAADGVISFTELLRVIAYYNAGEYHADPGNGLDGYAPGPAPAK